jgi:hypothetical protein
MTADFSNVSAQKVTGESTANYELYDIQGMEEAYLVVTPATRSNKAWNNAFLHKTIPDQRRIQGGKITAGYIEKHRSDLVPLVAAYCVKGWHKVVDRNNAEVPFTPDDCLRFLQAMPNQSFDNLFEFVSDEANFRTPVGELAGN